MMSAIALKSGSWGDATMNSAQASRARRPSSSVMVAVPSAETPTGVGDLDGTVNFLVVGGRAPFLIGHGGSLMVTVFLTTGMVTVQEEPQSAQLKSQGKMLSTLRLTWTLALLFRSSGRSPWMLTELEE